MASITLTPSEQEIQELLSQYPEGSQSSKNLYSLFLHDCLRQFPSILLEESLLQDKLLSTTPISLATKFNKENIGQRFPYDWDWWGGKWFPTLIGLAVVAFVTPDQLWLLCENSGVVRSDRPKIRPDCPYPQGKNPAPSAPPSPSKYNELSESVTMLFL